MYRGLKARRAEMGLTQKDVAKLVGINPNYLCRVENGREIPSNSLKGRIAEALHSDINDLFKESESKQVLVEKSPVSRKISITLPNDGREVSVRFAGTKMYIETDTSSSVVLS